MDDLRARCKRMQFPGNAVIESGTNGNKRSQLFTAIFAAYAPCIPRFPIKSGWLVGIAPRPIIVVTTGTPVFSTTSWNTLLAWEILIPPPARKRGFFALESVLIARFSCPMWTLVFGACSRGYLRSLDILHCPVQPLHPWAGQ